MNSSTIAATTITWSAPNAAARWSSFRARLNALSRKLAARTSTCRRATPSRFTAYANAVRRSRSASWREVTNGAWKRVFCAWSADRAHATLCRPKRRLLVIRPDYVNYQPLGRKNLVPMRTKLYTISPDLTHCARRLYLELNAPQGRRSVSWRPIVSARSVCGFVFVFALLVPAAFADTKEGHPRAAFQVISTSRSLEAGAGQAGGEGPQVHRQRTGAESGIHRLLGWPGEVACGVERSGRAADHHPQQWQIVIRHQYTGAA